MREKESERKKEKKRKKKLLFLFRQLGRKDEGLSGKKKKDRKKPIFFSRVRKEGERKGEREGGTKMETNLICLFRQLERKKGGCEKGKEESRENIRFVNQK